MLTVTLNSLEIGKNLLRYRTLWKICIKINRITIIVAYISYALPNGRLNYITGYTPSFSILQKHPHYHKNAKCRLSSVNDHDFLTRIMSDNIQICIFPCAVIYIRDRFGLHWKERAYCECLNVYHNSNESIVVCWLPSNVLS